MSQNIDKLMKQERDIIMKAYDRDVINGKQNWSISNGEKYYNLHYSGDNKGKYNSDNNQEERTE